jgi:starch synthase (maltosyl-transferring)
VGAKRGPGKRTIAKIDGRERAVIEDVEPGVDGGRFAAKRVIGDEVRVRADVFGDGHEAVAARVLWRKAGGRKWRESPMEPIGNDRWEGRFTVDELGGWEFTIEAWIDAFSTWRNDLSKRIDAGQDVAVPLEVGARLVDAAADRARGESAKALLGWAARLRELAVGRRGDPRAALADELAERMARHPDRSHATRHPRALPIQVDRERARFGAWYEFFPRSTGRAGAHGTFATAAAFLPYVRDLGFDVVYLPPIHPVGHTKRKGANNAIEAGPGEPGSPWAIGAEEGGHAAIHPELGTLADFRAFRERAEELGLEVALDVAFQCSPDHPWVREHPEWFRHRPDGSIQFAENPPKQYEDIYPLDFETEAWRELWEELRTVFLFWIEQGVRIFRVDNPHTKPLSFWEWAIGTIRAEHPDTIFLAEAFTRPKIMYRLAKLGFTQSYTYFAWRNARWELTEYVRELTRRPVVDFFRPSFWPNTPDILTAALREGGRPAFASRFVLAATLSSNYGIYGPAFELMEAEPRDASSEEYRHSEKYEIKRWDIESPDSLRGLIARVNAARRENPAFTRTDNVTFHPVDAEALIAYSKRDEASGNTVLVIVNLDPAHRQAGFVDLDLAALGLEPDDAYEVHDLLGGGRWRWRGARNYVELDPEILPAHVFHVLADPPAPGSDA